MNFTFNRYCILLATCLSLSACSERTVSEMPEDTTDASNETSSVPVAATLSDANIDLGDTTEMVEAEAAQAEAEAMAAAQAEAEAMAAAQAEAEAAAAAQAEAEAAAAAQAEAEAAAAAQAEAEATAAAQAETEAAAAAQVEAEAMAAAQAEAEAAAAAQAAEVEEAAEIDDPPDTTDTTVATDETIEPPQEPVIGAPGASVDCQQTVPCSWVSEDSQFTVTITNTDNIGVRGRLVIQYHVTSLHDTEVQIISTEPAVDVNGNSYAANSLTFGDSIAGFSQAILAGAELQASIEFDQTSEADTLSSWSIGLSDSGVIRSPNFTNIKIGPFTSIDADCQNTLPCVWQTPSGDATITLLSVSGLGAINQLTTNFTIQTDRETVVAVDTGASAVDIDNQVYTGRTHGVGVETSFDKLTVATTAGATVSASIFFSRTPSVSTELRELSLIVYEDLPIPRWNPRFISVPVQ